MDVVKPKTYCEKWPVGCQFCDLLLCEGKKETAEERCNPCKPSQPECRECEFAKPMTNADRIRAMSDEELATFFGTLPCCPPGNADELCFPDNTCGADTKMMVKCWGTWLKSPVEKEGD